MPVLREYQEGPVRLAVEYFRMENPAPSLMVLPTGWGKSWLTAYVARSIPDGDRLLVVQPTKELLEQNYEKYMTLCGELAKAGIFSASFGKKQMSKITYATIGSIKNLGEAFRREGFTKMLIDEAHLYPRKEESMLGGFLADSGITHVLGITATPLKMETVKSQRMVQKKKPDGTPMVDSRGKPVMTKLYDGYSKLVMLTNPSNDGGFFRDIMCVGQIRQMTSLGFWTPLIYEPWPYDPKELKLNSSGSEFSSESELSSYELNRTREKILSVLDFHHERRHVLVFVPTVEEAQALSEMVPDSAYVCGETPKKERAEIIRRFRAGEIRVIFNVSVLSVGFDYPLIDCIVLSSPTASISRYYQIAGRAVRIHPEKKDALVVDLGGNVARFGRIEDLWFEWDRIWRLYGTGGQLLSGIPIENIGDFHRDDVYRMINFTNTVKTYPFGRYKGVDMEEVPLGFLRWILHQRVQNGDTGDLEFLDRVRHMLENDIRDTRGEAPLVMMPTGIHQGKKFVDIPKNYLWWLKKNTRWTPYNDSLRRGIDLALQQETIFG